MKHKVFGKKAIAIISVLSLAISVFAGCSGNSGASGNKVMLDLGSIMPTSNTTATADNPEVIQASKYIAAAYERETGTKIAFATSYGRTISSTIEQTSEWYQHQMQTGNCPMIGFTSLNYFQDRDYYVVLDEYLEKPNPYVEAGQPGSVHWKDMFYDYVWEDGTIQNVNGEIVALPILLSAGTQTAVYYNKDIFEDTHVSLPNNWNEFKNIMSTVSGKGYESFQPYSETTSLRLYSWALTYSLTPNVLDWMRTTENESFNIDYDKDGKLTNKEVLRGVMEGKFDPRKEGPARAVYEEAYNYYADTLPVGWLGKDYKTNWTRGSLAMVEQGVWNIPMENSNTARQFEYGMFTTPIAGKDTFPKYSSELKYYNSFEEINCPVSVAFNIMKAGVSDSNGNIIQEKLDRAVDILMYLSTVENCSAIAEEKGGTIGAVKGSDYNRLIDNATLGWKTQKFPKISLSANWPTGYTSAQSSIINKSFEEWVNGSITSTKFYNTLYEAQKTGARSYITAFNIDTSDWNI